jgi:hypothetical protein
MVTKKIKNRPRYKSLYYEQLAVKNAQIKEIAKLKEVITNRGTKVPTPLNYDLPTVARLVIKMLDAAVNSKEVTL